MQDAGRDGERASEQSGSARDQEKPSELHCATRHCQRAAGPRLRPSTSAQLFWATVVSRVAIGKLLAILHCKWAPFGPLLDFGELAASVEVSVEMS